jgi:hypothetical protein
VILIIEVRLPYFDEIMAGKPYNARGFANIRLTPFNDGHGPGQI